ncbi:MAG: GNAT family N-acetyltransferase [Paenalcaligenes sp.]
MRNVTHNTAENRFEILEESYLCTLEYLLQDNTLAITHTVVPRAVGGKGIAGELVKTALNYARDHQLRVIPQCSYAAVYVQRHPEYQDLVL